MVFRLAPEPASGESMSAQPLLARLEAAPDLVEQAYQVLHEAISAGALAPGERITQEDLARRLAVSRQPVLQALRLLKQDGLVLDAPGRGLQVAPLDPHSIVAVYQVRGALDALAAKLAAGLGACIDPGLIERGRAATRGRNVAAMIDADVAFHVAIYQASGNPLLQRSAQLHWSHIRRAIGAVLQGSGLRQTVWEEHEAIAEAITSGDGARAEGLMLEHSRCAAEYIVRELGATASDPPCGPAGSSASAPMTLTAPDRGDT